MVDGFILFYIFLRERREGLVSPWDAVVHAFSLKKSLKGMVMFLPQDSVKDLRL